MLRAEDVTHFLEQLDKFTTYRPLYKARNIPACSLVDPSGSMSVKLLIVHCFGVVFVAHR